MFLQLPFLALLNCSSSETSISSKRRKEAEIGHFAYTTIKLCRGDTTTSSSSSIWAVQPDVQSRHSRGELPERIITECVGVCVCLCDCGRGSGGGSSSLYCTFFLFSFLFFSFLLFSPFCVLFLSERMRRWFHHHHNQPNHRRRRRRRQMKS